MDDKEYMKWFGKNLKHLLEITGISQTELAKHLGYSSKTTVCRWCSGESYPKDIETIMEIAKYLSVAPSVLISPSGDLTLETASKEANEQNINEIFFKEYFNLDVGQKIELLGYLKSLKGKAKD